jgi:hypothetical protein
MLAIYEVVEARHPDATAANDFATLEHQRGKSGARKICRRRQSVVTGADHNRIVDFRAHAAP